ncbi:MAG: hypothetical protein AAFU81_11815 [Pseudomonadota bacterium]
MRSLAVFVVALSATSLFLSFDQLGTGNTEGGLWLIGIGGFGLAVAEKLWKSARPAARGFRPRRHRILWIIFPGSRR